MVVGIARIELHVPGASSLKQKRSVVKSIKDRVRTRFHAAVAEVDHQDLWQRAALGVAVVSADGGHAMEVLHAVRRLVEGTPGAELLEWEEVFQ